MNPPTCMLCRSAHWSYQGHELARVEVGPIVKSLHVKPVTKPVTTRNSVQKPVTRTEKPVTPPGQVKALVCGHYAAKPIRGPNPSFCSSACKQTAHRRKAVHA